MEVRVSGHYPLYSSVSLEFCPRLGELQSRCERLSRAIPTELSGLFQFLQGKQCNDITAVDYTHQFAELRCITAVQLRAVEGSSELGGLHPAGPDGNKSPRSVRFLFRCPNPSLVTCCLRYGVSPFSSVPSATCA